MPIVGNRQLQTFEHAPRAHVKVPKTADDNPTKSQKKKIKNVEKKQRLIDAAVARGLE